MQTKCGAVKNDVRFQKYIKPTTCRILKMTQVFELKSIKQVKYVKGRKAAGISLTL